MRKGALFVFAIFPRFSLDSARTKNPSAKMAVTQKINRAALDIFILFILFYAPALVISLCRNRSSHSAIQCPGCSAGACEDGKPKIGRTTKRRSIGNQ
jgi:hypothetical protein